MKKQIRPLVAFKKANPEHYSTIMGCVPDNLSAKAKENYFYFLYATVFMGVERIKDTFDPITIELIEYIKTTYSAEGKSEEQIEQRIEQIKSGHSHRTTTEYNSFFFNSIGEETNMGTVSEIGRFLLTGWFYDVQEFSKEISGYVYNAYKKTEASGDVFNDLDFQKAVKHIRENIRYYYNNSQELKLYILKTFFNDKLKTLLPAPPDKLDRHIKAIDFLTEIRKNDKAKGVDFWINKASEYEGYYYYLQEILENCDIDHLSLDDYNKEQNKENDVYWNEIDNLEKDYMNTLSTVNLTNLIN